MLVKKLAAPVITATAVAIAAGVWLGRAIDRAVRAINP